MKTISYEKLRNNTMRNFFGSFHIPKNIYKLYKNKDKENTIIKITDPVTEILYLTKILKQQKILIHNKESFPFKINNTYRLVIISF